MTLSPEQIAHFDQEGFLLVEDFIDSDLAKSVAERFEFIFRGNFETTVPPDEWRWAEGRDPDNVTRMIWNGWKSDKTIASLALSEKVGEYCAELAHWPGTRLNQDGCLWKPPGSSGLAFHQDGSYVEWIVPAELMTCWIALDEVGETTGTLEYARGSHLWPSGERPDNFHAPEDHQALVKKTAKMLGEKLEIVTVKLKPGGAAFHHHWLWHGSGPNNSNEHRRALALHCMSSDAKFHPTKPAFAQGRYRKFNDTTMEESFYPILWQRDGYRSKFITGYLIGQGNKTYKSHTFKSEQ